MVDLDRKNELEGRQERKCLYRSTKNGEWLSAIPHHLNGTEMFREELRDKLCIRYVLMAQDIPNNLL